MLPPSLLLRQLALIVGVLCLQLVSAAALPIPGYSMAYATVDENTFYIHGGIMMDGPYQNSIPQFYSLDLTKSGWDTSSPPWTALTYPFKVKKAMDLYDHSMTVSPDGKTLTTWDRNSAANYSITSNSWTHILVDLDIDINHRPATDPTTGNVYFPGGSVNSTIKYNFALGHSIIESIPTTLGAITNSWPSFVWCQARKSFILFGGDTNTKNPFFEYTPSNSQWKVLVLILLPERRAVWNLRTTGPRSFSLVGAQRLEVEHLSETFISLMSRV
ncbi:MAG: hypothetical protein J3R72DRAFT_255318 [Linnemannia gamsii]|nr:MAG: hypothetical protein J3R72DRAFT_255318 [Linnemannia gamsii]